MELLKKLLRFFAAAGNSKKQRNSFASRTAPITEKSGALTREQLAEVLQWLSDY